MSPMLNSYIIHQSRCQCIQSNTPQIYTAPMGANMCLWPVCQIFMAGPRRHGARKVPNTWRTVHNVCMNISHTARNKYCGVRSTFRSEFHIWPLARMQRDKLWQITHRARWVPVKKRKERTGRKKTNKKSSVCMFECAQQSMTCRRKSSHNKSQNSPQCRMTPRCKSLCESPKKYHHITNKHAQVSINETVYPFVYAHNDLIALGASPTLATSHTCG